MKIVLLNDSFPPMIDGVANTVCNYAEILTKKGHEVLVVTPEYPGVEDHYPYEVVRYKSLDTTRMIGYRAGLPFDNAVLARVEAFAPDLIHTHCPFVSLVMARVLRKITGAPIVLTYHTKFDIELQKYISAELHREAAQKFLSDSIAAVDDVWVVSDGAGENLYRLGYHGRYTVMENGVDFPRGGVSEAQIAAVPTLAALPKDLPIFLFVGRMMWYKGVRISLDALKLAQDEGIDFRMLMVGDGAERQAMEEYAREIGIGDKVIFTGAIRDRELLRAYFTRADLFLFPSTFDTNGIVVREAAACALPSVLIRKSCAAEGITDGRNGLLIDENARSMLTVIRRAAGDTQQMHEIGLAAQREIYVPWEASVEKAIARYEVVASRAKQGDYHHADSHREDFFEVVSGIYAYIAGMRDIEISLYLKYNELHERLEELLEEHNDWL